MGETVDEDRLDPASQEGGHSVPEDGELEDDNIGPFQFSLFGGDIAWLILILLVCGNGWGFGGGFGGGRPGASEKSGADAPSGSADERISGAADPSDGLPHLV